MTDRTQDDMDAAQRAREHDTEELRKEQEGKGFGDDEGEREESLPEK
jgi:hypothetical protein